MKKLLTLILSVIVAIGCCFGLTACGEEAVVVGAQQGTTGHMYAQALKNVEAQGYDTPALAAQDLKNGKISYIVVDKATASALVASDEANLKMIDIALTSEDYAIGVDKTQTTLLSQINTVLASKASEIATILASDYNSLATYVNPEEKSASKAATQLVVATNAEFEPFEGVSGNGYKGYDISIAQLIAQELGLTLIIDDMAFESVVTSIGNNNVDIAMAALTVTAARKSSINFSNPYYKESQVVVTLKSNEALDEAGTVIDVLSAFGALGK